MQPTTWNSEFILGQDSLDIAHRSLFAELTRLASLPQEEFATGFEDTIAAVERDFRAEEALMERLDDDNLAAHREQHARVLSGLHHAAAALAEGDSKVAHQAVFLLGEWLPLHITTMDRALAASVERARCAPQHRTAE